MPFLTTAQAGGTYTLTVPIAGASAAPTVCGWIDFNRNTTFDATERACSTGLTAGATSAPLTFNVPTATAAGPLYVRLRAATTPRRRRRRRAPPTPARPRTT